jgi:1-acyl-sn-glycerol-3-phosphate acyltransferase
VVCNHYSRPDFPTWWITFVISAVLAKQRAAGAPEEIHWVMTAAWTFPESAWRRLLLMPLTRWAFRRTAYVYGFVTMPPMPPAPHEVEQRASAVLRTVRLARREAGRGVLIGLAPEGRDTDQGLGATPPGVGRFISLLASAGLDILPVGVAEWEGKLQVSFGPPFRLQSCADQAQRDGVVAGQVVVAGQRERDRAVADQVMAAIAAQLPAGYIRGEANGR